MRNTAPLVAADGSHPRAHGAMVGITIKLRTLYSMVTIVPEALGSLTKHLHYPENLARELVRTALVNPRGRERESAA